MMVSSCIVRAVSIAVLLTSHVNSQFTMPGIKCAVPDLVIPNLNATVENQACPSEINDAIVLTMGRALNSLTYQRGWKGSKDSSPYPEFIKKDIKETTKPRLGLCEIGCSSKKNCAPGLFCTADYQTDLKNRGYNPLYANCGGTSSNEPVCFDPIILARRRLGEVVHSDPTINSEQQHHRQLPCDIKCSTTCNGPPDPAACLYINCSGCRRRQLVGHGKEEEEEMMTTTFDANDEEEEEDRRHRSLQTSSSTTIGGQLVALAQSKLREMSTWTNITQPTCLAYLARATCVAM